ncbi:DNA-binding SARP family transcriptional activator [Thiogranum longum]|uniref:DNA-binding SARP family transcriptional activator n=1 Tax=Thiogranum longum TaxID=1537524 RepID=A0A4R1HJW5_9GAMM|nr:BTAD domain-containing putative transcriptional regulator [Thiogranum longum]TCK17522.1 DNA-binding SARP family transcriptional activator [Thiogranum longum]
MGINLESRTIQRLYQQHPVSSWSREPTGKRGETPVRIHALGRFSVQTHHYPIALTQLRQQKPFELLQALIAFGGRDVHRETLAAALWPDADGDQAQNTFDVTLHRLRHIFGIKNLFMLHDCKLTLSSQMAWVDVWAFERTVNFNERLLVRARDPAILRQLSRSSERLLNLYQGAFLEREAVRPWMLSLRERLRSKLLRFILDSGKVWEARREWGQAIRLYQKGLEVEPLGEALYQQLIICYRDSGRFSEAINTFHQCRKQLAEQLHIQPSPVTFNLYQSLKSRPTAS